MNAPTPLLHPHRLARIMLWAKTMLAWFGEALFGTATPNRRRIRQRYRYASLDRIERLVRALAVIRATELARIRERPRRTWHNAAPAGFQRRTRRSSLMRAAVGARFRKALKARDLRERLRRLLDALADLDALARRHLVPRALRRLTKLCAITVVTPPAAQVRSLTSPRPCIADSS